MAQAEVITVRMSRGNLETSWGFEIIPPLTISNVIGGSLADRAGLLNGDSLVELEGHENLDLTLARQLLSKAQHKIELVVHRAGGEVHRIWKPSITENTEFSRFQHTSHEQHSNEQNSQTYAARQTAAAPTKTPTNVPLKVSLEHQNQASMNIPGFNVAAQPYGSSQEVKHLQYNSPMPLYSPQSAAEQYLQQTGGLFGTDPNIGKMKEQPSYLRSETLRLIQENEQSKGASDQQQPIAPQMRSAQTPHTKIGDEVRSTITTTQNTSGPPQCFLCGRNILGVMCRAFDRTLHAECFQCATCGSSLKNQGHHFLNDKFYCDIHGRQLKGRQHDENYGNIRSTSSITTTSKSLHPQHAVGSGGTISPTVIDTRRSQQQQQENVRAFYQPEIMSRRPLSISPQPWKTQGPISPSNRAVPASGIRYGQSLRSESYTSSTTKPQQQSTDHRLMDNQSPYAVVQYVPLPSQIRSVTSPRQQLNKHKWPPPSVLSVQKFWPLDVDEHRSETGDGQIERFDQREANDDGEENRVIHEENIQFKEQANEQRFAESTDVIADDNNADERVHRSETLHGATERSPLNDESSRYHAKKRSFAAEVNLDFNAIQSQHLNDEIDDDIAATIISADEFGDRPKPTVRHSLLGSSASVSKSTTSSVTLTEHLPRVTISNSLSFGGNEVEHLSTGGVICQEGNPGNNHQQQQCTDANGTLSSSIARDPRPAPRLSRKPETELPRQSDGGKKKVSAKGSLNDGTDKIIWHTIIKANDEGQEVMKTTTITARNETEAETTANYQRSPLAKQREVVEEQDLFTALDDKNTVNIDMPSWRYEASKWRNQHSASGSVDDATVVHADKNNKHSEDFWNAKHQFDIQSHFDREQLNGSDRICGALNIDSDDRACNDDDIKSGKGDKKKSVSDDDRSYGVSDGRNNYSDTFEKLITRSGDEDEEEEEVEIPIIDIHKDSYIITSAKYHKRCDHSSRRTKERNSRRQVGDVTKRALASSGSVELSKNLTNDLLEASSKSLYRHNDCRDNDDKTAEAIVENSIPLATTPVQLRDEQNEPVHSTKYSLARQRIEEAEQQRDEDLIQIELFRRKNIERLTELSEQLAKWHDDYTATTELGMACRSYDDDAVIQSASLNNCLVAPVRMASECFDTYEQATSKNHQQHEDQNRTKEGEWIKIDEELSKKVDETKAEVDKSKALSRIRGSSLEREGDENSSRKHLLRSRRRRSDGEKEMRLLDENDKRIAIASIERHQRQLHEQQQQLFELLDNAIFFLKNLDTNTLQQRSLTPQSSDFSERTAHLDEISTSVASPSKHAALSTGHMITQQKNDEDEGKDHKDDYSAADRSMSADQQRRIDIERFPDRSTASIHNESDHHTSPASTSDHHAHHSYLETPAQTIMRAINEFSNNETLHQQLPCKTHNSSSNKFGTTTTTQQYQQRQGDDSVKGRGTLETQGSRIPFCEHCKQQIRGAYVLANGLAWCPEHFVCANKACNRRLLDIGFVEDKGQKYCENCFENLIAPHCAKCNRPITADCLNALQKQWHPQCFVCAHCHKPFGNSAFFLEQGLPYCETDWNALFTTKCVSCHYPIEAGDRWVEALGSAFHSNCFNCTSCNVNLEGESFYAKNGAPYCKLHA